MSSTEHAGPAAMAARDVFTVSRLNSEVRWLLEDHFGQVWVEGEISNLVRPRSGHLYFTLKDAGAQVRCAMFRMHNRILTFAPADGAHVLVQGRVSLYRERGDYQLVAEYMELAGAGALRARFEQLRARLAAEGLFQPERKQTLPAFPVRIGVVTSPTGAAVRDVLKVLRRRSPGIEVIVYPTRVQGDGAAEEIASTLRLADRRAECDVLLLVRGGGSLEDLWAFNEEITARAIYDCTTPVVAGIGHETDFTIADFVADVRAPTPSAAAEVVSPDRAELGRRIERLELRLLGRTRAHLAGQARALDLTFKRLRHPRLHLEQLAQRTDDRLVRLTRALESAFPRNHRRLAELDARLGRVGPLAALQSHASRCAALRATLLARLRHQLAERAATLGGLERALHAISPQRTLERGYAVVSRTDGRGEILRDAATAPPGTRVRTRLARGTLLCAVESVESPPAPTPPPGGSGAL